MNIKYSDILNLIKSYDEDTYKHSLRVAKLSYRIACELSSNTIFTRNVVLSALLHDVGKIKIPKEILNYPGKLSDSDYKLIQNHPLYNQDILKGVVDDNIIEFSMLHHERLDGQGYPFKLKDIPLESKIIAIVDVYDAVTSKRVYKDEIDISKAFEILETNQGFDQEIVTILKNIIK